MNLGRSRLGVASWQYGWITSVWADSGVTMEWMRFINIIRDHLKRRLIVGCECRMIRVVLG